MRYRLLGPLEVTRDGKRVPLGGPKQRLVLAHLLTRPSETVSTELLIDEIWGDSPPDAARQSIQSYASNLRKALGPDTLEGRPPGYVLHAAPDEIDAVRFSSLSGRARQLTTSDPSAAARLFREALAQWQGEPLADLADEVSLHPEIERLREMRLSVLEDLVEAELTLGRHRDQIPELERLVARHPLRERLHAQLMLALYRAGRQADALAAYRRLREALDAELGVDPSPAIEELQRQILTQDAALLPRGEQLRGYRVTGRIGSGPLGVVHRGFHPQSDRDLAIKVLGARIANDADFIRRFDAETRRIAKIENPHLLPIHDWWREPDAAYVAMRFMPGGSLGDRLAAGSVAPEDVERWAEQLGSGLAAAHRHGVVHGDLHPGNVLLDDEGNAYLADFAAGFDPVAMGSALSGPRADCLAPERRQAGPTAAADIFALGTLLGQAIDATGASAAEGAVAATLARATAAEPAERPSSAAELTAELRRGTAIAPATPAPPAAPPRNPYKGLRAFEEADALDFAGREETVRSLVGRMTERGAGARLLAVVGPSGSGKSSVVDAGLIPALRSGAVSGSERWFVTTMTPGARPFEQFERALRSVAIGRVPAASELRAEANLSLAAERLLPGDAELLLVIQQFEELYTVLADDAERHGFLAAVTDALSAPGSRLRVVLTLRADFYDRPLAEGRFGQLLALRTYVLPALTPEELERVIVEPAARAGLELERGLAARIVAEMSEHPGALPLLQYVLSELWERRDEGRLTLAAYEASGGISGAVSRRAEELVQELDAGQHEAARQLFLQLVELGEGSPDTARRVRRSDVEARGAEPGPVEAVIDRFVRYRLLLLDREAESREPTVQLAHEALLRAWPRLRRWVDDARDDLRNQRRLAAAAAGWVESDRDSSFLLRGSRLEQARAWAEGTTLQLGPLESDFLAESLSDAERATVAEEERRLHERRLEQRALVRLRALVITLALGAFIAAGLSLFALSESQRATREARDARARELAAGAVANLEVDPERAILLALEAIDVTRVADGSVRPEAEEALHRAVVASRVVMTVTGLGGDVDWSPAGDLFVTEGPENSGIIDLRDAATGASVRSWQGHEVDINDVAFSGDGTMLATAGDDGVARVWEVATGVELAAASGVTGTPSSPSVVRSPSFSPDGRLVAAAWPDENVVRILDLASGDVREMELTLPDHTAFSPDGTRLAVAAAPNTVVLLDVDTGTEIARLEQELLVFRSAWSPDGRWLATGGLPARIWDANDPGAEPRFVLTDTGAVDFAWSSDGATLLTGSEDGTAAVWSVSDQGISRRYTLSSSDHGRLWSVALSPDGERAMTSEGLGADREPVVKVWDLGLGGDAESANLPADPGWSHVLDFTTPDRLVVGGRGGSVTVWDLERNEPAQQVGGHGPTGDPLGPMVLKAAVSPGSDLIATAGNDGVALVSDATSGEVVLTVRPEFATEVRWVEDVAWSPDGQELAVAANSFPAAGSHVLVVDRIGREIARIESPGVRPERVAFSPDGRLLAIAWIDTDTFLVERWHVMLWDRERQESERTIAVPARGLAFDPTSGQLAVVNDAGFAQIFDVASGELAATLSGHAGGLSRSISYSADGQLVATAGEDSTVRLWDAETGRLRLTLRGHDSVVSRAVFSPDDTMLASTGADGVVRLWALDLDDLVAIAQDNVTRDLTDDECRQFLHTDGCQDGP